MWILWWGTVTLDVSLYAKTWSDRTNNENTGAFLRLKQDKVLQTFPESLQRQNEPWQMRY